MIPQIVIIDAESRHCTTQSLNYFVSKAAALELSTPTLYLNKQVSLLQGPACASPAVNLISLDSLETITHCFHLIVSDKRLCCRLSVHLSSEISTSIFPSQRVGGLNCCDVYTPVKSRLHITSKFVLTLFDSWTSQFSHLYIISLSVGSA